MKIIILILEILTRSLTVMFAWNTLISPLGITTISLMWAFGFTLTPYIIMPSLMLLERDLTKGSSLINVFITLVVLFMLIFVSIFI
jgi:hypothetical protein